LCRSNSRSGTPHCCNKHSAGTEAGASHTPVTDRQGVDQATTTETHKYKTSIS
jgi:hypothetical protein